MHWIGGGHRRCHINRNYEFVMHTELEYKTSESRSVVCERRLHLLRIGLQIFFESLSTQTGRWDETLSFYYVLLLLWVVVDVQITPNSGNGFCRDACQSFSSFRVNLCWIMLNLWLIFSAWLIESGFPPVWWAELWAEPFPHGPHFSKLKGQTSKPPNDNHHAWCVYCFQKGDGVYYR